MARVRSLPVELLASDLSSPWELNDDDELEVNISEDFEASSVLRDSNPSSVFCFNKGEFNFYENN